MENLDSVLEKLRKARYISKIDFEQAFLQVSVEMNSRKNTAFAVQSAGLFQFTRWFVQYTKDLLQVDGPALWT